MDGSAGNDHCAVAGRESEVKRERVRTRDDASSSFVAGKHNARQERI